MTNTTTTAPGWGETYDRMSPAIRARCQADDRDFERARLAEQRRRAIDAEHLEQRSIRAAVEQAELRGEYVSVAEVARTGGACLGRTRAEFVAYTSAMQDMQDAQQARTQPAPVDTQQYAALQLTVNPTAGRTRAEAVAYYSALGDLQDLEAARRIQQGLPTTDEEAAQQALDARQAARYSARAREHHVQVVAQGAAQRVLRNDYERQYFDGEITEEQLSQAGRALS